MKCTVVQSQVICITLRGNDLLLYEHSCCRCSLSIREEGNSPGADEIAVYLALSAREECASAGVAAYETAL